MKLVFKMINNNEVINSYEYSRDEFLFNGRKINVDNKIIKLVHLFSLINEWKDSETDKVSQGFFISVDSKDGYKEYVFSKNVPDNFLNFISEVERIALEG